MLLRLRLFLPAQPVTTLRATTLPCLDSSLLLSTTSVPAPGQNNGSPLFSSFLLPLRHSLTDDGMDPLANTVTECHTLLKFFFEVLSQSTFYCPVHIYQFLDIWEKLFKNRFNSRFCFVGHVFEQTIKAKSLHNFVHV